MSFRLSKASILEAFASLGMAALVFSPLAMAATTANVTATVTIQNIAVSVSDGTVAYGTVSAGGVAVDTTGVANETQTATNDSNVTATLNIPGANSSPDGWVLASTASANQYIHDFCVTDCDGTPTWTPLTTSYQTLAASVAASGTQDFDLRFTPPSSTTYFDEQSLTVTVQATL